MNKVSPAITTERLALRRFTFDDAPFFIRLLNDPDWIRFIGDRNVHDEEQARAYMSRAYMAQYDKMGFGLYLVEQLEDGAPIGMCGLIKRDGLDDVDIGFAFLREYRGKGYAFEAAQAAIINGRDQWNVRRVVGIATPDNVVSIALLKKLGMQFERETALPPHGETLAVYGMQC